MPFHVRDPETDALVRQLARQRRIGLTDAIKLAVRQELEREAESIPLRDRISTLRAEVLARPPTGQEADKAFFDDLSGEP